MSDDRPAINPQSVEFIYEHTRGAPERQHHDMLDLDGKAAQLMAAASVVLGFAALSAHPKLTPVGIASAVLTVLALLVYVALVVVALRQIRPVQVSASSFAGTLWDEHWDQPPDEIRHSVVEGIRDAYNKNDRLVKSKSANVGLLIKLAAAQTILVAIAVVLGRLA